MPIIKIDENTTNISKLLFFTIHLHFVISNQISTYRKLNLPLRSSIYFAFLPLEMQERLKQTVCDAFSYFSWKGTTHKPLKVAVFFPKAARLVPIIYFPKSILLAQLDSMNVFHSMWLPKCLLFVKVHCYWDTSLSAMLLLSLKPVFLKKSVFYALSPQ